jgi:hypothetical protein
MSNFKFLNPTFSDNYLNLKKDIFSDNLCWLYQKNSEDLKNKESDIYQNLPIYYHNVLSRKYDNETETDRIRSALYPRIIDVLNDIFSFNNITINCYHRISINSCSNVNPPVRSPIHVDHPWDHQQVLIYLTDSFAPTIIYNKKYTPGYNKKDTCYDSNTIKDEDILLKIYPHSDNIITFDGLYYHAYDYPTLETERRIVLVCTYS